MWPARQAKPRFGVSLVRSAHDYDTRSLQPDEKHMHSKLTYLSLYGYHSSGKHRSCRTRSHRCYCCLSSCARHLRGSSWAVVTAPWVSSWTVAVGSEKQPSDRDKDLDRGQGRMQDMVPLALELDMALGS